LLNDGEKVADGAGEAIEPDHDQGVGRPDGAQQTREHGSAAIGAGGVFPENLGAAGRLQLVKLGIRALIVG
jgi:hypothetical protein